MPFRQYSYVSDSLNCQNAHLIEPSGSILKSTYIRILFIITKVQYYHNVDCYNEKFLLPGMHLIIGYMFKYDLYWSGEVGCVATITLETGRNDWRSQTKHKIV